MIERSPIITPCNPGRMKPNHGTSRNACPTAERYRHCRNRRGCSLRCWAFGQTKVCRAYKPGPSKAGPRMNVVKQVNHEIQSFLHIKYYYKLYLFNMLPKKCAFMGGFFSQNEPTIPLSPYSPFSYGEFALALFFSPLAGQQVIRPILLPGCS